ncbi:hypothetical protein KDA00_03010 [Candidatus Saccharibacteria bacterium]|nr:hypothetical protein [Candidatus Saccharibacteria bacterium]
MIKKMLIDNNDLHFSQVDLPLLIHGNDGYGASLFSMSVMADLYAQDVNIVFLCGYHMARDEFDLQTQSKQNSVIVDNNFNAQAIMGKRVIFIPSEQPELLGQVLEVLSDSEERVVFFKNFDLFDESVFSAVENLSKLVMMGDIDKCTYRNKLLDKNWATQIYFSMPEIEVQIRIPELEKYKGYLKSNDKEGIVSLVQ